MKRVFKAFVGVDGGLVKRFFVVEHTGYKGNTIETICECATRSKAVMIKNALMAYHNPKKVRPVK
jgi:hypothetical protein